ncbi:MAG: hypothetical protein GF398_11240 [Chitinivibrionales bacterium]|nr:hypothetical protein [Chitinivibrionales bacterium]
MNSILVAMFAAMLIPLYKASQDTDIWQKLLAFSSIATKAAIIILTVSVFRDDWMIGVVAIIILSVGNAALMLLAQLIKRMPDDHKFK